MAKKTKAPSKQDVEAYKHGKAKRKMIPTAEQQGFVEEEEARPKRLRYPRNPDLDPQLIWAGGRFQVPREQLEAALANGGFLDLEAAHLVWKGKDDEDSTDLFADAPPIYIQEKISSRQIIERLKRDSAQRRETSSAMPDLFADFNGRPTDLEARTEFYAHDQNWSNRMILGDSLLVMAGLAERENLRGKVQCIYIDPPYGIKFNSNWQAKTGSRDVRDGKQESISREPEVIKAFRDTWKDGIHSYLNYLRDRLVAAHELLNETGSVFVQIGEENAHLARALLDEIFGAQNAVSTIIFMKTAGATSEYLSGIYDAIIW
jgi:adenine-specific DNA-methyltransferase